MQKGYVYIVAHDDPEWRAFRPVVKVGSTWDLDKRLNNLSTASPVPLTLAGIIRTEVPDRLEKSIHNKLHQYRINGEWFIVDYYMMGRLKEFEIENSRLDELFTVAEKFDDVRTLKYRLGIQEGIVSVRDRQIKALFKTIKQLDPAVYDMMQHRNYW